MKTLLVLFGAAIAATVALTGCGLNDASPSDASDRATVRTHFFPQDNGMIYTYSRYNNDKYDTLECNLVIGQRQDSRNSLVYHNATSNANSVLYYVSYTTDVYGNVAAELATDDSKLLALDGELVPGATWIADPIRNIRATVVEHYDEYYLPGREAHFSDVVAVKYHQDSQPDNVYTVRFFARGQGLIFERLVAANTEISSLQILSIQYPTNHNTLDRKQHRGPQSMIWAPVMEENNY
jgi:hypothetical protein